MNLLLKMAWLNIWRNKRRTGLLLCSMTVGLVGILFSMGFMRGWIEQMVASNLERFEGHIKVTHPDYQKRPTIDHTMPAFPDHVGTSTILHRSDRLVLPGLVSTPEHARPVNLVGVDPVSEAEVSQVPGRLIEGTFLDRPDKNQVVIGKKLADKIDKGVGKRLVLTSQRADGEIGAAAYRIAGIYDSESPSFDERHVYLRRSTLAEMVGLENQVTETVLMLEDAGKSLAVESALNAAITNPTVRAYAWESRLPAMVQTIAWSRKSMLPYYTIFFLAMAFGILNTQLMALGDRTREIGVMMAIGLRRLKLVGLVLVESLMLGLVAAALGACIGLALNGWLASTGIDLSGFEHAADTFGAGQMIYPRLTLGDIGLATAATGLVTILFSIYPALRASRMKPVDALRWTG